MEAIFEAFTPGQYLDFEKDLVEQKKRDFAAVLDGTAPQRPEPPAKPYTQEEILAYNKKWDPYNPLFNDPEYAKAAGYSGVPAAPGFCGRPANSVRPFPKDISVGGFYYTNDGSDIYTARPIVAGDFLVTGPSEPLFEEVTIPGSVCREWIMGGRGTLVDSATGQVVVSCIGNTRECWKKRADGGEPISFYENMTEWCTYFPPAHVTTDEDWATIRTLWANEKIRGSEPLYWEDVDIGTFVPETCSGPITYMDMAAWYGSVQLTREMLSNPEFTKTCFRDINGNYLFETAIHLGGRNVPGARMVFFNDTAAHHVARAVTNFIGDQGYVCRYAWRFYPFYREMRNYKPHDYDLICQVVPGYENRPLNRHGAEGDTVIGKAYVYDKYIDGAGRHIIKLCGWGETLDGDIIEVCPMEAVLPSRAE